MSFFRSLTNLFDRQPIVTRMFLTDDAVHLSVMRDGKPITRQDLSRYIEQKRIPEPLRVFLGGMSSKNEISYLISYLTARKLATAINPFNSKDFQVECDAILRLRTISRPADFHLSYSFSSGQLVRRIYGAERHIGGLWFQKDETVWGMVDTNPSDEVKWLARPTIPTAFVLKFVTQILPVCMQELLPVQCTVVVKDDAKLSLVTVFDPGSVGFSVASNIPDLLPLLSYFDDERKHLAAGNTILQNLGPSVTDTILKLARSRGELRLSGNDLLQFLYAEVKPRAAALNVNWAQIEGRYPVISSSQLKFKWHLRQRTERGIGAYSAELMMEAGTLGLGAKKVAAQPSSTRFIPFAGNYWLELSDDLREKLASVDFGLEGRLTPAEVIGVASQRMSTTRLSAPVVSKVTGNGSDTHALAILRMATEYGLPLLFSGLQSDLPNTLIEICQHLLEASPQNSILWIVEPRKRNAIINLIQQTDWRSQNAVKRILVLSADKLNHRDPSKHWSLVIFHNLDATMTGMFTPEVYSEIKRRWTVGTLANESTLQHQDRLKRILQAFQLSPGAASVFLGKCSYKLQDQREGLITRLVSPFKKLVLDETARSESGSAIPKRPTPSLPTPSAVISQHPVSVSRISPNVSFLEEARQLAQHVEVSATPIPFMQYFPTYAAMTPAQRLWYFYWRGQVREGKWLPTDLSYQFVHIYEVINLVGFRTPQAAYDHLTKFWKHYRTLQPKLDRYLPDWIGDFVIIHQLQDALDWYASLDDVPSVDANLQMQAWLHKGGHWDQQSLNMMFRVSSYDPTKNKFFKENNQGGRVTKAYLKGLVTIDDYLSQSRGRGLFKVLEPNKEMQIKRPPFANAIHDYKVPMVNVAKVRTWQEHTPLVEAIVAILKYTENIIRPKMGVNTKLRGFTISPEWSEALDTAFGVSRTVSTDRASTPKRRGRPPKVTVSSDTVSNSESVAGGASDEFVIDMERVGGIVGESDYVRERLTVNEDEPNSEVSELQSPISETVLVSKPQSDQLDIGSTTESTKVPVDESADLVLDLSGLDDLLRASDEVRSMLTVEGDSQEDKPQELVRVPSDVVARPYAERPANTPDHLLTDLEEVVSILGQPNSQASRILRILREHDWQLEAKALAKLVDADFLNVDMGYLNDAAAQYIGDSLVLEEDGIWIVAEDYRDELEFILTNPHFIENASSSLSSDEQHDQQNAQISSPYAELPQEWSGFAERLHSNHWESLAVFVQGVDISIRLDAIARAYLTTPTRLVDELNEYALDTIGDYVVEITPSLEIDESVRESFSVLLNWAARHNIAEM